ncbi:hypothetical protein OG895_36435 [Streptomyces sp. NBC_00201]|uniref:hypothetical protein n=1 Tax=unclassified Streptomyces TaxID=2593676 RepID=UPI00225C0E82|nr:MULTISPECIES: hypothetical protein [unclassified Streptomyces]MCX5250629.1 hypothetical protein [Streptomyces sp. NBC_00201]MCX5291442.1 hypothetical protein [Streptomyces sp. NBC_00183]
MRLRLMSAEELADDPRPGLCVELSPSPYRPENGRIDVPRTLRISPTDVVRLRQETDLVLGEMRVQVLRAQLAWKQSLGRWYEEGRAAVESSPPERELLTRVLEGLRRNNLAPD